MDPKRQWRLVKQSLRIEEALDALGLNSRRQGDELWASCPLPSHGGADRNPSFSVNVAKGLYNCFSCGAGGDMPALVRELQGCSYADAVAFLCEYADVVAEDEAFIRMLKATMARDLREYLTDPVMPIHPMSRAEEWHSKAHLLDKWFGDRMISPTAVKTLMLGYEPKHRKGEFVGPAAMIPHFFEGRFVGFQCRWIGWEKDWPVPKYVASRDFPKHTVYNYDRAIRYRGPVFVVESAMTVARLESAGHMAVATFGASIIDEQLRILRRFKHLIACYDNDDSGRGATNRIATLDRSVYLDILEPPPGKKADLGDLGDQRLEEHIRRAVPFSSWASGA